MSTLSSSFAQFVSMNDFVIQWCSSKCFLLCILAGISMSSSQNKLHSKHTKKTDNICLLKKSVSITEENGRRRLISINIFLYAPGRLSLSFE